MTHVAKPLIVSIIATVQPAFGGGVASAQTVMLGADATLSTIPYTIPLTLSPAPMSSYAISQTDYRVTGSANADNFTLNGSGVVVTATAGSGSGFSGSDTIAAIFQATQGGAGVTSAPPGQAGTSGSITTTLESSTIVLNYMQGAPVAGIFGLHAESIGAAGGGSTSHHYNGAQGAAAATVDLTLTNSSVSVNTTASAAGGAAISARGLGGFGGAGYHDVSAGRGGGANAVTVTLTDTAVVASGGGIDGVAATQVGGAGGVAAPNHDNSNGATGGSGSSVTVTLAQGASGLGNAITTTGNNAAGILATATGGSGTSGGAAGSGVDFNETSGNGGDGGNSGAIGQTNVSVISTGVLSITTSGADSSGIQAVTQGGQGANGGDVQALSGVNAGVAGMGGRGDPVVVNLGGGGTITTRGATSSAILAQALGGQGGNSGSIYANAAIADTPDGGAGGETGLVSVTLANGVTLTTTGDSSDGITARSIGGLGGNAGAANAGLAVAKAGNGGAGGASGGITISSGATITTSGITSRGMLVQALSGGGGVGGDAGGAVGNTSGKAGRGGSLDPINVTNYGAITTYGGHGDHSGYSQGILAQSISGSGGAAGSAGGSLFYDKGGDGTAGSAGGTINLTNSGAITTYGESSQAIVAQSIGGGGGTGGPAGGMLVVAGGAGGRGGAGGDVLLTLSGDATTALSTAGTLSHAIVAQSIGGGGGLGGNAYGTGVIASVAVGGTAGAGGAGGTVTVGATGLNAATAGSGAIGMLAQSVGGSGGAGGAAYATSAFGLLDYSAAVGGSGGDGGSPGQVGVTLSGSNITTGVGEDNTTNPNNQFDAIGVLAQSIGGSGGVGGGASALAVAIALPYPTEEGLQGTPTMSVAVSVGGAGGNGGSAKFDGNAASVSLGNGSQIVTNGTGSTGVSVQSIGGGGGQGGDSSAMAAAIGYGNATPVDENPLSNMAVNVSLAVGGQCVAPSPGGAKPASCVGGDGGGATLTVGNNNTATNTMITTNNDYAIGGMVQSLGGGGGNAGIGSAQANSIGVSSTTSVTINVGSNGGVGGNGGTASATINADGVIATKGVSSTGLLVHSIGGGGGVASGGGFDLSGLASWAKKVEDVQVTPTFNINPSVQIGMKGGTGGDGGTVNISHFGTITTEGTQAAGIIAQSIGGGGGVGGTAGVPPSSDTSTSDTAIVRHALEGVPMPTVNITRTLEFGGKGGSGGVGGAVTVNLAGSITTLGDYSAALMAQSIGGGGGVGGLAVAGGSSNSPISFAQLTFNTSLSLGANGSGGTGADGGSVTVNVGGYPTLTTSGFHAIGILAQSVGGGGGSAYDGSDAPSGSFVLGLTTDFPGGHAGNGGDVVLLAPADAYRGIYTSGDAAHAVFLQSVGGGGGAAAAGSTTANSDWDVNFTLGGGAGAAGDGGRVTANFSPQTYIGTTGDGAIGIGAQSVGGGGGMTAASAGVKAIVKSFGLDYTFNGSSSDGSAVSIAMGGHSYITTSGVGSHGIVAQSIGGGGGMFTQYVSTGPAPQLTEQYTGDPVHAVGVGGAVTVDIANNSDIISLITTKGAGAFGIIAQSIGGGGGLIANNGSVFVGHTGTARTALSHGGPVTVTVNADISASGENSGGVLAQSSGPGGAAGPVTVNVGGTVAGGSGAQGVGILIAGGNASNQVNVSATGVISALSGTAIAARGSGTTNVNNQGAISGTVGLNGGSLDGDYAFKGQPPIGSAGTLTNAGMLVAMPGKRSYVDGHFIQTAAGHIAPHLDYSNGLSGTYEVTGNAVLDGAIRPNLASAMPHIFLPALTVNGSVTGSLDIPDSALFSYTLRENAGQYDIAITDTHFNEDRFGLSEHHSAVASALETVFASGDAELGPFFAGLDSSAGSDLALFRRTLDTVAHRNVMAVFARAAADASRIADASMSCPKFSSTETGAQAFLTEDSCIYATAGGQTVSLKGESGRGKADMDSAFWQLGGQTEVGSGLFLGGLLAYQTDWFSSQGVSARGASGQGAVTLKYQTGALLFTGALFGSVGEYDIERTIMVPGFSTRASSSPHSYVAGVRGRVAYTFGSEDFYLRPYLNVDLTHARSEAFSEDGAGGLGLRVDEVRLNTVVFTPAIEFGGRLQLSQDMALRSYVSGGVNVRSNDTWEGHASFNGGGLDQGFSLDVPIDRISGRVSAGLQLFMSEQTDVHLQYDGEFGSQAQKHNATASFSYRF